MASKRKYPKPPKKTASLSTWTRYKQQIQVIDKHNKDVENEKKKKAQLIDSVVKLRSSKRK